MQLYQRGEDRGQRLYEAWRTLDAHDCLRPMLWSSRESSAMRGDLPGFAQFMTAPGRDIFFFHTETEELAGLIWYDDVTATRLTLSICLLPHFRGALGAQAAREFIAQLFDRSTVERMVAYTPWRPAKLFAMSVGFRPVAIVPEAVLLDDQAYDLHILHCDRASFQAR